LKLELRLTFACHFTLTPTITFTLTTIQDIISYKFEMSPISGLLKCYEDIMFLILEFCDHSSVNHLSLTCKALRLHCLPHLYRTVDLSFHNIGRLPQYEGTVLPEAWANTCDSFRPEDLFSKQRCLLRTLSEHPKYANLIRDFSWTLIWYNDSHQEESPAIKYRIWSIFSCLVNVETLDLACLGEDGIEDHYVRYIPALLFPAVTNLRLLGWMHHDLVTNILNSIDLSKVRNLNLDALQEEGQIQNGSPMPESLNERLDDQDMLLRDLYKNKVNRLHENRIIFPGPMWLPIVPIIDKLSLLQCLEVRIPPLELDIRDYRNSMDPGYWKYIRIISDLITSVCSTLERLVLDFARDIKYSASGGCGTFRGHMLTCQARRLYISHEILSCLLAVFLDDEKWKWSKLRNVCLRGFLDHTRGEYKDGNTIAILQLRNQVDISLAFRGIEFQWLDDSPRPATLFKGYDYAIEKVSKSEFNQLLSDWACLTAV
jgi:hypothetical protein